MAGRRFEMHRDLVRGPGYDQPFRGPVADGVVWPDGTVSVRWRGPYPSVVFWADLRTAQHVHGHDGATDFVFLDEG